MQFAHIREEIVGMEQSQKSNLWYSVKFSWLFVLLKMGGMKLKKI